MLKAPRSGVAVAMANPTRQSLSSALRTRLDSWWVIGIFGVIFLASQIAIAVILHKVGHATVLRLQTTLSADTLAQGFERLRETGKLAAYRSHYWLDFVHPAWYGILLSASLAKAFRGNAVSSKFDFVVLVPFVAALLDLVENLCHVLFLSSPGAIVAPLVVLSGLAAILKWSLVAACIVIVLVLALRGALQRRA